MARQNTFTVIPKVPRFDADTTPSRPMTSKQVRKAYKDASKTPTMTRAERIKWERGEQERIRKELDKEKTAAKARAARERKKEKENQQREEKRRNGLPLVNVRPSQDTIARFVRGNGSKKRDAEGSLVTAQVAPPEKQEADATTPEEDAAVLGSILEEEDLEGNLDENEATTNVTGDELPLPKIDNNTSEHKVGSEVGETTVHDEKTDDKRAEPAIDLLLEDYDVDLSLEEPIDEAEFDAALDLVPEPDELSVAQPACEAESSGKQAVQKTVSVMPSQDLLDEEINTDMLDELDELVSGGKTPAKPQSARLSPPRRMAANPHTNTTPHKEHKQTRHGPGKRRSPLQRKVQILSSPEQPRQAPPMGTQAILVNFDDFFPTSSQQLLELEEEEESSQQDATVQPPTHDIQKGTTPNTTTPSQGVSKHPPVTKPNIDIGDFESEFGSFPSNAHFSLLECSMAPPPTRPTPPIGKPTARASATSISELEPATPPPPPLPQQPSRFFTSSGSREQLSLALQRSRRSAALEQIQEKERQRQEAGLVMRQSLCDEARRPASPVRPCDADRGSAASGGKAAAAQLGAGKENVQPELRCSQETEYGGDWVEDAAWDLALC